MGVYRETFLDRVAVPAVLVEGPRLSLRSGGGVSVAVVAGGLGGVSRASLGLLCNGLVERRSKAFVLRLLSTGGFHGAVDGSNQVPSFFVGIIPHVNLGPGFPHPLTDFYLR